MGSGSSPVDGQQVVFDYTGYNESGTPIDSSYRKGRAAEVRLGINGLIPGAGVGVVLCVRVCVHACAAGTPIWCHGLQLQCPKFCGALSSLHKAYGQMQGLAAAPSRA